MPPLCHADAGDNTTTMCTTWTGVTCHQIDRVTHLRLPTFNLTATIDPILGVLDAMVHLELSGCNLSGTLPEELSNTTLIQLTVHENSLTGPLPAWSAMSQLTVAQMSTNPWGVSDK